MYIDFDPSRWNRIKKRRSVIIISQDEYALCSSFIIVCSIITSHKMRPYFVDIQFEKQKSGGKVITKQLSADASVLLFFYSSFIFPILGKKSRRYTGVNNK
ncbi:type II toxin-antitoxin system PemK/MazF family toxin [Enterococcus sp. DIV0876]|uniref:type II toxin-antitoxin system PemK/MazF family toxin n=1 Tax=Enterococcus sp. DIV0876 TaxID=2774633 RepID=UPI003D30059F